MWRGKRHQRVKKSFRGVTTKTESRNVGGIAKKKLKHQIECGGGGDAICKNLFLKRKIERGSRQKT